MRILIIHNALNDSNSMNGVLRHYVWMAEHWNRSGHQTDFLVAKVAYSQIRQFAPSARLFSSDDYFDATKHMHQTWRYFPAYLWRMLSAHVLSLPDRYDVVYASSQTIYDMYPAMILCQRLDAALAVKIHHVIATQTQRHGLADRLFSWSERITARWINRRADLVICNTPLVAADFASLEKAVHLEPTAKIHLGCGVEYEVLARHRSEQKIYDAVILSRMHKQKGVFDIARFWSAVIAKNPRARLLVIGEGAHRSIAQQMVREAGLDGSILFTGGIPESEKNRLVGQAKIGVSLSYEEGWGMAVNEFLALGLPTVAYHLPVFDYVFPDQLILVTRGNAEAAGAEVARLLADDAGRAELSRRGSEFVRRYDFAELGRAELAALSAAVEKHRPKAVTTFKSPGQSAAR